MATKKKMVEKLPESAVTWKTMKTAHRKKKSGFCFKCTEPSRFFKLELIKNTNT